eukprot:gb/GECG01004559.1/.p1 GENE.gb/GECG01004559.1/~~gb/GECG01004559.1/.p1  ORF type:complete len:167 (+),score=23.33 gb/GECG01004559.1/:1-501(+)
MFRTKPACAVLEDFCGHEIASAVVANSSGGVLASSGTHRSHQEEAKHRASVAANAWNEYQNSSEATMSSSTLNELMFDLDDGTVIVLPIVLDYLLIVSIGETTRMGYIRAELRRMKKFFADQLQNIGLDTRPKDKESQQQGSDQGDSQGGNDTEDTSDAATPPASS